MDRPDVDRADLESALGHVAAVNRWLGARRALLHHLPDALPAAPDGRAPAGAPSPPPPRVLDVGTGSGDLPRALHRWARGHRPLRITAVDLHAATLRVARDRLRETPSVRLVRADGLRLPFATGAFDLALLSMTLHHMDGRSQVDILEELGRVARGGRVLVGELERSIPHYLGARLLAATVWRRNPVTRHDGPLSVRRGFTPGEMLDLARRAGLGQPEVHRHPVFRLVLRAEAGGE